MRNVILFAIMAVAMTLLPVDDAGAVEPLSTAELTSHCKYYQDDPDGKDGIFCVRYVQGFIDGAVATDERVTMNVADEYERDESFSERAIRVRLGKRLERFGPSYFAEFCLGAPVPLREVVQKVALALDDQDFVERNPLAREAVYLVLRKHYPCQKP